ncbi:MAG: alpha-amylase [Sinomicrobium sp.]|nr:alpha-amylase [Sinomicrobium sp.]
MKDSIQKTFLAIVILFAVACKKEGKNTEAMQEKESDTAVASISDDALETATIYEANIRQYSPEGTFNAFARDIPALKKLGVDIIWVMPVYPISKTKRKAAGGIFVEAIADPEAREKVLGSYYAVTDYTKVNPEFGTLEDFRNLVKTAHDNGMYIILDWVANHTGWDHVWLKEHPEYYTQNDQGEVIDPVNEETGESWGWGDVADLNYNNQEMRREMIAAMKYWVTEENIDGFRCDVAFAVPTDFWEAATAELRSVKPVFMLAEAETPELLKNAFDMQYGWELMHIMNTIAKGEKNVYALDHYMATRDSFLEKGDMYMYFTSNHDENSWNGTVYERYGAGAETFAALTYMLPGMPLIYSGQEYDLDKRLAFFEKDTIPKTKGNFYPFYEKMNALKASNMALHGGKNPASYTRIPTSEDEKIIAFTRAKGNDEVIFIANLTGTAVDFTLPVNGVYTNYRRKSEEHFKGESRMSFQPWEYRILVKPQK